MLFRSAVLASWAWFARFDVTLLEAYSIPPALAAGAIGWSLRRRRPKFGSWAAYGVPLAVGFLPSVAAALEHGGPRSIVVVGFAVAAVVVGATRQLQAPLVVGAAALTVIAVQTLWPVALQVPRWVSIGGAGLLFLWLGATAERRLGQLRRLADRYECLG